jgi:hypothetical protein
MSLPGSSSSQHRYAFDVVGELFFGQQFGFMQNPHDHESYIASLDNLLPVMMTASLVPPAFRGLVLGFSVFSSTVRKGYKAIKHISAAARGCVARRANANTKSESQGDRTDLLHHLLNIMKNKGEAVDFGKGEVESEAYSAMYEHISSGLRAIKLLTMTCAVLPVQTPRPLCCALYSIT